VSLGVDRTFVRATYQDLGMASDQNRKPLKRFELLTTICEGNGEFRWKRLGTIKTAKWQVGDLREAMKVLFGLKTDPFFPYNDDQGWRARFRATAREEE
jgi:hypothetical protein